MKGWVNVGGTIGVQEFSTLTISEVVQPTGTVTKLIVAPGFLRNLSVKLTELQEPAEQVVAAAPATSSGVMERMHLTSVLIKRMRVYAAAIEAMLPPSSGTYLLLRIW